MRIVDYPNEKDLIIFGYLFNRDESNVIFLCANRNSDLQFIFDNIIKSDSGTWTVTSAIHKDFKHFNFVFDEDFSEEDFNKLLPLVKTKSVYEKFKLDNIKEKLDIILDEDNTTS